MMRQKHEEWMTEELEKRKKELLESKEQLANDIREVTLDEGELKDIQIEAENAVQEREELEGIYPEDYLEPEELSAQEDEEEDYSDNDSDYEASEDENISFGTEEDETLKNNIQILVESGDAQAYKKKNKPSHKKEKRKKPKKKNRAKRKPKNHDIEISTNKQEPSKKEEEKKRGKERRSSTKACCQKEEKEKIP